MPAGNLLDEGNGAHYVCVNHFIAVLTVLVMAAITVAGIHVSQPHANAVQKEDLVALLQGMKEYREDARQDRAAVRLDISDIKKDMRELRQFLSKNLTFKIEKSELLVPGHPLPELEDVKP